MPPRQIWRPHGSSDEVDIVLTGWEWVRILKYLNNKYLFVLTLITRIASAIMPYIMSLIQGDLTTLLVDSYFSDGKKFQTAINDTANRLYISVIITFVLGVCNTVVESNFVPQFLRDLKTAVMRALLNHDIEYYDQTETGIIIARITDDVENAYNAYTNNVLSLVQSIVQWIAGLIICFSKSAKLTVYLLIVSPLYVIIERLGNRKLDQLWLEYNNCSTTVSAKATEILTSFRTVRSFDAELREYQIYKKQLYDVHRVVKKNSYIHGTREFCSSIVQWGSAAMILYITGTQAARGEVEPGVIVVFMTISDLWNSAFAGIFSLFAEFKKSNVSSAKLLEILEKEPSIKRNVGRQLSHVEGRIEFKDVTFKYATREKPALNKLNFTVEPNTTVAIVGESGCGKSTVLQLIERFYDVQEGQILVDGVDVKDIAPSSLRKFIAFVPQTPTMFSMNIKNNIRYGKPGAHKDEIISAAKIANAHEFIIQQPQSYGTSVHQNSLSGGQKQRLCIARAVMKDAPILLLDEATAALDAESERLVQDAIGSYRVGKTVIIVAHRLSTVKYAEKILVMKEGQVIESGTHEELLAKGGEYAELVKNQLQ